jgi:hypothetical protein
MGTERGGVGPSIYSDGNSFKNRQSSNSINDAEPMSPRGMPSDWRFLSPGRSRRPQLPAGLKMPCFASSRSSTLEIM